MTFVTGVAGGAIAAVGKGVEMAGILQQGQADSLQYEYKAATYQSDVQADNYNVDIANRNALIAMSQARSNVVLQQRAAEKTIGAARAAYGASGVQRSEDVLAESATNAEIDKQTIFYEANLKAQGFRDTAAVEKNNAAKDAMLEEAARQAARDTRKGTKIAAVAKGFEAAASALSQVYTGDTRTGPSVSADSGRK